MTGRRPLTREDVMLASEAADLLHMSKATLYRLAADGEVPGRRIGRLWRFLRPEIEAWLQAESEEYMSSAYRLPEYRSDGTAREQD
jgi:excisionase family DNA binding protein